MKTEKKKPENSPLSVDVIGRLLVISIGVETLKHGHNLAGFRIGNASGFAKDVAIRLTRQREDGSGILTDLLEKAVLEASENGSPNVIFTERCKHGTSGNYCAQCEGGPLP